MDSVDEHPRHPRLHTVLAGLQAGIAGALFMLLWHLVAGIWTRRSFWSIPNIYATGFYGSSVYVNGFTRGSWSGVALIVTICGVLGALWGVAGGAEKKPYLGLFGAVCGLMIYYLLFNLILSHVSPLIPLYAPQVQVRVGYLIWGITLSRAPVYAQRIADSAGAGSSWRASR